MKISSMSKYALGTLVAAGILAGCSTSAQSGLGQTGATPSINRGGDMSTVAAMKLEPLHQLAPAGFVMPDKKKKKVKGEFAYITGIYTDVASVYEYKSGKFGKEVGTVSGLDEPQGVCGNATVAWIANTGTSTLLSYKPGSLTSSGTLTDSGEYPTDCTMDSKGDIAVSNIESTAGSAGDITLYKGGKGNGTSITCPNLERYYFITYDSKGDLFVDGEPTLTSGFGFCEVPAGKTTGTAITLSANPEFPGGVQMIGSDVTILDQDSSTIDEYTIKGSKGTEKGTIALSESGDDLVCDWVDGSSFVLAANLTAGQGDSFALPKGGAAVSDVSVEDALGIALTGK